MRWDFKELKPGEPERDPREAEFFRLTEPAEALVREFIQNSLDAKKWESTVRVRFAFGEIEKNKVRDYFDGLESHIQACNFLPPAYTNSDRVPYLTIEDFGTTGLDGDTGEDGYRPEKSNFFDFWWREGKSHKGGHEAGRWGLGKTTFHLASKIRSFWGLTVRQDDSRELLMGKALLRTHRVDSAVYHYYGYFTSEGYRPVKDKQHIRDFKKKFSVCRNSDFGFSLVIPLPDEDITASAVVQSVTIHYFYAIMKGFLEVEVRESDKCVILNTDNLMDIIQSQDWQGTSWEGVHVLELLQFVSSSIHATDVVEARIADALSPDITEDSFGYRIKELRDSFNLGNPVAFRIPVVIKEVNKEPSLTHFKVYLKKCLGLKRPEEFYIRSGITIVGIRTLGSRGVRGMLVAEDDIISTFLGDAETPAHTEWNERTEGFKGKYENAVRILRFIRKSMGKIATILEEPPKERQRDFLKEIFSVPSKVPEEGTAITRKPKIPEIPLKPAAFEVTKINRGFRVSLSRTDIGFPIRARITVAYDVRRGNPFKQYNPYDFDLGRGLMTVKSRRCKILSKNRQIIEIEVRKKNFNLEVTGFDSKKDLVVNVKEEKDETQV